jgi:hypothetical protein
MEIWEPIRGYENYEVSNLGRVKSLNYRNTGKEKILKSYKDENGYLRIVLYKNGKGKHFKIHRLVAMMFLENSENKPFINHIDCNPSNNCVSNLEWCTQKENIQYASQLKRMHGGSKKTPLIAINLTTGEEICFNSQHEAAKKLNLHRPNINRVLKGIYKKAGNYTFKYITN